MTSLKNLYILGTLQAKVSDSPTVELDAKLVLSYEINMHSLHYYVSERQISADTWYSEGDLVVFELSDLIISSFIISSYFTDQTANFVLCVKRKKQKCYILSS